MITPTGCQRGFVAVDQQHCRPFGDEQLRGRFADTVGRPGDHRYFAFQPIHRRPPV